MKNIIRIAIVVVMSLSILTLTGCSKGANQPSHEDIIKEIMKADNITFAKDLEVVSVREVLKKRYGNLKDGKYPVKTFVLVDTKNHGLVYIFQEMVFEKKVPEYGEAHWVGTTEYGVGYSKDKLDLKDFMKMNPTMQAFDK